MAIFLRPLCFFGRHFGWRLNSFSLSFALLKWLLKNFLVFFCFLFIKKNYLWSFCFHSRLENQSFSSRGSSFLRNRLFRHTSNTFGYVVQIHWAKSRSSTYFWRPGPPLERRKIIFSSLLAVFLRLLCVFPGLNFSALRARCLLFVFFSFHCILNNTLGPSCFHSGIEN